MKRTMKSLVSLMLAVALAASMGVMAFAANEYSVDVSGMGHFVTYDNPPDFVDSGVDFTLTLEAVPGYRVPDDVTVVVDNIDVTSSVYDADTHEIFIDGSILTESSNGTIVISCSDAVTLVTYEYVAGLSTAKNMPSPITGLIDKGADFVVSATVPTDSSGKYIFDAWEAVINSTYVVAPGATIDGTKTTDRITLTAMWTQISSGTGDDSAPSNSGSGSGSSSSSTSNTTFWSNTLSTVKAAKVGETVKIDMSNRGSMSADVLKAIDGKDVTLSVSNGSQTVTINGKALKLDGSTSYSFNSLLNIYAPAATLPTPTVPVNPGTGARA